MQELTYVFLAGIGNSGDGHWQRAWHDAMPNSVWVEHADWQRPDRDAWVSDLQATVWKLRGPMVVVAHSLGCLLLAEWARTRNDPSLLGGFLVAVPDPDAAAFPAAAKGFEDPTATRLSFPTVVVASRDDPYASFDYAEDMAERWGAELVDAGHIGHINAESGLGEWPEGRALFEGFVRRLSVSGSSSAP